jgi:hypothetical protein
MTEEKALNLECGQDRGQDIDLVYISVKECGQDRGQGIEMR